MRKMIFILMLAGLLASCGNKEKEKSASASTPIHVREKIGIDIHEGTVINWEEVKKDPDYEVTFVIVRFTMGDKKADKKALKNLNAAINAGMKVGAYHFLYFNKSGITQANNFLKIYSKVKTDYPPMVDIEIFKRYTVWVKVQVKGKGKGKHTKRVPVIHPTPQEVKKGVGELSRFVNVVEKKTSQKPVIYSSANFFDTYLQGFDNQRWVAATDRTGFGNNVLIHQFSQKLRIQGIKNPVDGNKLLAINSQN